MPSSETRPSTASLETPRGAIDFREKIAEKMREKRKVQCSVFCLCYLLTWLCISCASCARATVDLFVRRSGEPGSLSHRLRQFRGRRSGFGSDDAAFASESEMPRV